MGRSATQVAALATITGAADIDAYEMDLVREGKATCRLVLSAHKLDYFDTEYFDTENVRVVFAATIMGLECPLARSRESRVLAPEALSNQLDASVTVLDAMPGTRVEVRHAQS